MSTKRIIALMLSLIMALACLPAGASARSSEGAGSGSRSQGQGGLELDTDGSDGYSGDYVMIYNPNEGYSDDNNDYKLYTGDLTGLISTEVDGPSQSGAKAVPDENGLYILDVDAEIDEYNSIHDPDYGKIDETGGMRISFEVGDTRNFFVSANYSPSGTTSMLFKVLVKSEYCYVWTPADDVEFYYPLDVIAPGYAEEIAAEFDRIYPLMLDSFGAHSNGANGDGRVNLLFFNFDDGYEPGVSPYYTAGYFSSSSYSKDKMPVINVDTYPGLLVIREDGSSYLRPASDCFHIFVHEYQHCINYSIGKLNKWLNESFSGAAEEICYPGSALVSRIQSWLNYFYRENDDWLDPPKEFEYTESFAQHNGFSIYNWKSHDPDYLAEYAQVLFFSQYMCTHYGNSSLRQILEYKNSANVSEQEAIAHVVGMSCADLIKNLRIAMYANDPVSMGGLYGFRMQEGYDPSGYHGVASMYDLLGPLVFTGAGCDIDGGGAICVKPVGGVFYPPEDAEAGLEYVGITRHTTVKDYTRYEPVDTVTEGGDYLLGCETENGVYVLLPYNPDYPEGGTEYYRAVVNGELFHTNYSYGIKASLDEYGNIVGFDDPAYPNALPEYAEWTLIRSQGWSINSKCMPGRFLYADLTLVGDSLFASESDNGVRWSYSYNTRDLYCSALNRAKYVAFFPETGGMSNMFAVRSGSGTPIRFFKRVDGLNEQYHTVTFLDRDGSVLMSVRLPVGVDPIPPAVEREGYTFLGWDGDYIGATEDVTVNAVYSVHSHLLTVEYLFTDGSEAAPAYSETLEYGAEYYVESPEAEGFLPDCGCIEGIMGDSDVSYTVIYYPEAVLLPGDVDGDGVVSFTDVALLYLYLVGMADIQPDCLINADYDGDGSVNFIDISELALMLT